MVIGELRYVHVKLGSRSRGEAACLSLQAGLHIRGNATNQGASRSGDACCGLISTYDQFGGVSAAVTLHCLAFDPRDNDPPESE